MPNTAPEHEAKMKLGREKLEFLRSDSLSTTIDLKKALDSPELADVVGILWAILMHQDAQTQVLIEMAQGVAAQAAVLEKMSQAPTNAPDPMDIVNKAMEIFGTNPEMMKGIMENFMGGKTSTPGVSTQTMDGGKAT